MLGNKEKNKRIKYINCINCPGFCRGNNNDKEARQMLKSLEADNYEEIIFSCRYLEQLQAAFSDRLRALAPLIKIGYRDQGGRISYFK